MKNINFADSEAVKHYIKENGFGKPKPPLTRVLSAEVFKLHYYDKRELMAFCRAVNISSHGLKSELNERIALFLRTGEVTRVKAKKPCGRPDSERGLALDSVVVHYKSDKKTRDFFHKHLPKFTGFSAFVQKWLKEQLAVGEQFTYREVIAKHQEFQCNKQLVQQNKLIQPAKVAHESCEFNQFYLDYSHDSEAKIHKAQDAWQLIRGSEGEKTYQRYKLRINEIFRVLEGKKNHPPISRKTKGAGHFDDN